MSEQPEEVYEFEGFRVDARRRLLTRAGRGVPLTPKAFDTLLALLRGGGRLLKKDELISEVWPDSFVEEGSLAQNIFLLRRALGEGKGEHRFIVTVPGAGYLFVPRVHDPRAAPQPCPPTDDRAIGSLAVTHFKALGVDKPDEPLGAGLADALTRRLSSLRGIKVLPTSAALGRNGSGPQAAGVEALLHGLYQRDGARLRVSVQLARVCDGAIVWAAKFDEQAADTFAVQDSVSERVAQALALRLNGHERRHLSVVRDAQDERQRRTS